MRMISGGANRLVHIKHVELARDAFEEHGVVHEIIICKEEGLDLKPKAFQQAMV